MKKYETFSQHKLRRFHHQNAFDSILEKLKQNFVTSLFTDRNEAKFYNDNELRLITHKWQATRLQQKQSLNWNLHLGLCNDYQEGQVQIHTGFHRFTEIGQNFDNNNKKKICICF